MALSPEVVHQRLRQSAGRVRWSRSLRYLISGSAITLFFLITGLILDAGFHFGTPGRWVAFVFTVAPFAGALMLGFLAWRPAVSEASIARRIEGSCAGSGNVLISAVQFDSTLAPDSPLRHALFSEMEDPFPKVRWEDVFDLKLLKRLAIALGIAVVAIAAWAVARPLYFANSAARILLPAKEIAPLTRTRIITITPGDDQIVKGGDFSVKVELGGVVPRSAWVHFREAGSDWQKMLMGHETGQPAFTAAWKQVRQPMQYYVEAGDAESGVCRVSVRPRTAVKSRTARIELPAYTKAPEVTINEFATLNEVLPGSKIVLTLEFTYPLGELSVAADNGPAAGVEKLTPERWQITQRITGNTTLKLAYKDTDGLADSETLQIITKIDEPPKITITEPAEGKELLATCAATLPIRFTSTDNYGLSSVALYRSTPEAQDAQLVQEWPGAAGQPSFSTVAEVPLKSFSDAADERVTFSIIAKDRNDVTGPGVTVSRPIVVSLRSTDSVRKQVEDAVTKLQKSLEDLIQLQQTNLDQTRATARLKAQDGQAYTPLMNRQVEIGDLGNTLLATADFITPKLRGELRAVCDNEIKEAILAFRNAVSAPAETRLRFVARAIELQATILARLQGTPLAAGNEAVKGEMVDIFAGVEDLLRKQREIHRDTVQATEAAAPALSQKQDALADQSARVRQMLDKTAQNRALGDKEFIARIGVAAKMFADLRIYEEMLTAAEKLQNKKLPDAIVTQKQIISNLGKIIEMLNQWQFAQADKKAEELKAVAKAIAEKLDKLAAIQREIVEKSKALAKKDEFRPEDLASAQEIKESKDLMAQVIEQMLTDGHIFPDFKPANELRSELVSIFEDVQQTDKEDAEMGNLKPQEIAVQKEDGILKALEEAEKIAADMEMWLPNKNETQKWLMENFDTHEMPEIPLLPLPEVFEDLVGQFLEEQKDLAQDIQDAASNQVMAQNPANGWEVRDGPMGGFGAQGRSGNERPNKNEQTGRSSGGRQGMTSGEMAGDTAKNLEGSEVDARRTNDPMQQGHVKDEDGPSETKATGGGKAGAFGDRNGMDGNSPLRGADAPRQLATDAEAVKAKLLAEKTSKTAAQASLLYLKSNQLSDVARLMDQSQAALKEGRMQDFRSLHQRIVARLTDIKSNVASSEVVALPGTEGSRVTDKQLLGGAEGQAPAQYKEMVADYYRSLTSGK